MTVGPASPVPEISSDARANLERIEAILRRYPTWAPALNQLGPTAAKAGEPARAVAPLRLAAERNPRMQYWIWLCVCLDMLGSRPDAIRAIVSAVAVMPQTADACFAIGMVLDRLGCHQQAAGFFEECLARDPGRADARHRNGRNLQAVGQIEDAIAAYEVAIDQDPMQADYHADLSSALSNLGRFTQAAVSARTAIQLDPGHLVAHINLAHALISLNRSTEALPVYEAAAVLDPQSSLVGFGHAVALLKTGDFERGWSQYEWRWQDQQRPRPFTAPAWQGEALHGRTILLHAEQGLGDSLQFMRFTTQVAEWGGRVVLELPAGLVRLARPLPGVAEVVTVGSPLPDFDVHCPLGSLPHRLGLRLETIPARPYLSVPASHRAPAAEAMRRSAGVRAGERVVGLVWAGDPRPDQPRANLIDRRRSMPLELLSSLLRRDGLRFVSFQLGAARRQLAGSGLPVHDVMDGVRDFADTAAMLHGVDLLISVDTSMVHLAGGLGVPVWMMSRFDACWRWLEDRTESPWYPSMRIFRQPRPGDWAGLVAELGEALHAMPPWQSTLPAENPCCPAASGEELRRTG